MEGQFSRKIGRPTIIGVVLVMMLIAGGYALYRFDVSGILRSILESHIHPAVFIALMAFLPVLGAPINPFLVLVGMKFGIVEGILLSAVLMFFHMAATYFLVHSFLHDWVSRLLQRFKVSMPTILRDYTLWQVVIFMIVPGVPYAIKNNLLALAGYRFTPYMAINWLTQYGHGIPMIILGGAVIKMDLTIMGIAFLLLLAGYLLQQYVRKKIASKSGSKERQ